MSAAVRLPGGPAGVFSGTALIGVELIHNKTELAAILALPIQMIPKSLEYGGRPLSLPKERFGLLHLPSNSWPAVQKPMIVVLVDEPTVAETEQWLSVVKTVRGLPRCIFSMRDGT